MTRLLKIPKARKRLLLDFDAFYTAAQRRFNQLPMSARTYMVRSSSSRLSACFRPSACQLRSLRICRVRRARSRNSPDVDGLFTAQAQHHAASSWWPLSWHARSLPTCCGTLLATPWRPVESVHEPFRLSWAIAQSQIRLFTPRSLTSGSATSGALIFMSKKPGVSLP